MRGSGLRYRSLRASPEAKVRRNASAKSGDRIPRFFISALLSTSILPVDVKVYVGEVSSAIRASSCGIEHLLSWNHSSTVSPVKGWQHSVWSPEHNPHEALSVVPRVVPEGCWFEDYPKGGPAFRLAQNIAREDSRGGAARLVKRTRSRRVCRSPTSDRQPWLFDR